MRVLLTSTSYPSSDTDWKGLFIRRIIESLSARQDLKLDLWAPPGPVPDRANVILTGQDRQWLDQLMDQGGIAHQLRTHPLMGCHAAFSLLARMRRAIAGSNAEILHLNWLQSALAVPRSAATPQLIAALGTDFRLLKIPGMRHMLRRAFRARRTLICPNAKWMVAPLEAAFGDISRIRHVPFGIDPRWFQVPRKPDGTNLPWLVVSRLTRNKLGPLFAWAEPLFSGTARQLHLFGPLQEQIVVPSWVHYHGPVTPESLEKDWFSRAQGLITLSKHAEGLPQVMLEAMASGLPIIASPLSAHNELLTQSGSGRICRSPGELAEAIVQLETPETNACHGQKARAHAKAIAGTWDDCAERYARCYRELLEATA